MGVFGGLMLPGPRWLADERVARGAGGVVSPASCSMDLDMFSKNSDKYGKPFWVTEWTPCSCSALLLMFVARMQGATQCDHNSMQASEASYANAKQNAQLIKPAARQVADQSQQHAPQRGFLSAPGVSALKCKVRCELPTIKTSRCRAH